MKMKQHMDQGIKRVLRQYKGKGLDEVLAEYDINCYKCNGNCLFKDIFEEHNLSMKEEMEMKKKINEIIV